MTEERILDTFSPPGCRRPSVGSESALVAKTEGSPEGLSRGEGEVIANAALCRDEG
jgi:hypothetical protein